MFSFIQDIGFALRQLRKSRRFTAMATLTLGLGIGAATAIFSLVDAVLLRPLAFPQPRRIVALNTLSQGRSGKGALPVYNVRTNLLARSTAQQRFQTILISAFAIIALVLSAIGLYAVLSYMVQQRTAELGLRMALGAQRGNILELILRRGVMLAVAGLAIGLGISAVVTRFLVTLLFATQALDAATFVGMALLLLAISTFASVVPAYRASRLDPIETLRQQ